MAGSGHGRLVVGASRRGLRRCQDRPDPTSNPSFCHETHEGNGASEDDQQRPTEVPLHPKHEIQRDDHVGDIEPAMGHPAQRVPSGGAVQQVLVGQADDRHHREQDSGDERHYLEAQQRPRQSDHSHICGDRCGLFCRHLSSVTAGAELATRAQVAPLLNCGVGCGQWVISVLGPGGRRSQTTHPDVDHQRDKN